MATAENKENEPTTIDNKNDNVDDRNVEKLVLHFVTFSMLRIGLSPPDCSDATGACSVDLPR